MASALWPDILSGKSRESAGRKNRSGLPFEVGIHRAADNGIDKPKRCSRAWYWGVLSQAI